MTGGPLSHTVPSKLSAAQRELFERMWRFGCPAMSIARVLDLASAHIVSNFAKRLGLPRRAGGKHFINRHMGLWTDDEEELACYLFHAGEKVAGICTELSRRDRAVRTRIQRASKKFGHRDVTYLVWKSSS